MAFAPHPALLLMSACCPLLHLPVFLLSLSIFQYCLSHSCTPLLLLRPLPLELPQSVFYTFPLPPPVVKHEKKIKNPNVHSEVLHGSDVLIPTDTDVSLVDRQCGVHREKQDSADTVENVMVIYEPVYKSSSVLLCVIEKKHTFPI